MAKFSIQLRTSLEAGTKAIDRFWKPGFKPFVF
jgi:hypothetical protein